MKRREFLLTTLGAGLVLGAGPAFADFIGSGYFKDAEAKGDLPPVAERLPKNPAVAKMAELGTQGGELRMLMASPKDTRILVAYSYARLVCYDTDYKLVPDICESFDGARRAASSPSSCATATNGRTASPSPRRRSAISGKTSPTTRS